MNKTRALLILVLSTIGCVDAGIGMIPVEDIPLADEEEIPPEEPQGDPACFLHPTESILFPTVIGQSIARISSTVYAITSSGSENIVLIDENFNVLNSAMMTQSGLLLEGHPVGVAYKEGLPTYIGGLRSFYHVDWEQFMEDGNLDNALIRVIKDKMGIEYARPEYVEYQGETVLATADYYSPEGTRLRLFDPIKLMTASSTGSGDPGLWIKTCLVSDWIQSISFENGVVYLVRNTWGPQGWEIDTVDLETCEVKPFRRFSGTGSSELEGFRFMSNGSEMYLTGDVPGQNLWYGNLVPWEDQSPCESFL